MDTIDTIIFEISKKGLRRSVSREAILRVIADSKQPISANDLKCALDIQGKRFNKTTVYRELETLKQLGYVRELLLRNDAALYELSGSHHHHLVCVACGDVRHVILKDSWNKEERRMERREGFKILDHSLEFFGLCKKCQQ